MNDKVILNSDAHAEIYLNGAHVASWIPAGGEERLFFSQKSKTGTGVSLRGGVPVIFPQFADRGSLPQHGFARTQVWTLVESDEGYAKFELRDSEATRQLWDFAFLAEVTVSIGGNQLIVGLKVMNTDTKPFTFTAALHTYFRVKDVHQTQVEGLGGLHYWDKAAGGSESIQAENSTVGFEGQVDRVYFNVPLPVTIREPERSLEVSAEGFPDVVVWNPGAEIGAKMADLEADGYRHMVCVEAAVVGEPIYLEAGHSWQGKQLMRA